jgi:hypothetical protein
MSLDSTQKERCHPASLQGAHALSMSPSRKILAVAVGTAVQFFNLNGAEPIIPLGGPAYLAHPRGWENPGTGRSLRLD